MNKIVKTVYWLLAQWYAMEQAILWHAVECRAHLTTLQQVFLRRRIMLTRIMLTRRAQYAPSGHQAVENLCLASAIIWVVVWCLSAVLQTATSQSLHPDELKERQLLGQEEGTNSRPQPAPILLRSDTLTQHCAIPVSNGCEERSQCPNFGASWQALRPTLANHSVKVLGNWYPVAHSCIRMPDPMPRSRALMLTSHADGCVAAVLVRLVVTVHGQACQV
jgi:hypothetical protein